MDLRYNREVMKYEKKDAILALCVFVAFTTLSVVDWVLVTNFEVAASILQFTGRFIIIGVTFAIVIIKKQGLVCFCVIIWGQLA